MSYFGCMSLKRTKNVLLWELQPAVRCRLILTVDYYEVLVKKGLIIEYAICNSFVSFGYTNGMQISGLPVGRSSGLNLSHGIL